ncbi:hypothetical protein ACIGGE_10090 [Qipengyuania sp. NPDC077410]|uniref:hypothetical protein n=1 Tax=Qipengyuania sp. NPDC077410 TaxID=3364496 RepID=UPI0037CC7650
MIKKLLVFGIAMIGTPLMAAEDWWSAETDHFRVISEAGRETARDVAVNLERLHQSLRLFRGLPLDEGNVHDSEKVTIYQTGTVSDVGELAYSGDVAGFFIPRAGNSVAFAPATEERRSRGSLGTRGQTHEELSPGQVLFHEYTHYFSRQHAPAAYPFWYSEGFAELFATIRFTDDGFVLGEPPRYRNFVLRELSFNVKDILDLDTTENKVSGIDIARQYAYGWMFTSYLSFEPSRQGQLAKYLRLVTEGTPNLQAATQAFGDLDILQKDLGKYHRGRVRAISVNFPAGSDPEIELTKLTEAEAAVMPLHIRSTAGVRKRDAKNLAKTSRTLVASYPNSPAVLDAAMEAEFDAENLDAAADMANGLLALNSNSIRARTFLARIALEGAESDASKIELARQQLVDANSVDPNRPDVLTEYFNTFVYAGESIPDAAKIGLEKAFDIAPFDIGVRRSLAYLLLLENRSDEAIVILGPLINLPHASGEEIEELREMVEQAKSGITQPLLEELRPKLDHDEEEDAE